VWKPRHRWIVRLLWLHVPLVLVVGVAEGVGIVHATVECVPLVTFAVLASRTWNTQNVRSIVAGLGLMTASALLVHLGDGMIEMHFHFFVMLGVIGLYQDWRPFLVSIGFVAAHHGVVGVLSPHDVFDHQAGWTSPLQWAAFHAMFVLAASVVSVMSWWIIENSNRQARDELETSERRFRALIENSSDVVTVLDAIGIVLYDSPSTERVLGYSMSERVGSSGFDYVHPEDLDSATAVLRRVMDDGAIAKHLQIRVRHRNGSYVWIDASVSNLLHEPGVGGIVANFRDITQSKRLEDDLSHQAFHDSLTGLANRALLLDRIDHALRRTRDGRSPRLALLYLDLDDFKTVNDGLGHEAGDLILRSTAERISAVLREGDTASRLGGDEFAVLLEELTDPEIAYEVGARVLEAVCTPIDLDGTLVAVNASVGIVVSNGEEDAAALLRNADLAMYQAKGEGKGRFEIYEAGMHAAVVDRMALKADLRRALLADEFEPHYQPIVDLDSGAIVGVEALARWNHPRRGLIAPAEFIPIAEETGMIVALGSIVLHRACADTARWQAELGDAAPASVSVNLSPRQIRDRGIVTDVRSALESSGLAPACLTMEITESVLLEETSAVAETLAAIKAIGINIALDDFGTGYSSLSYLDKFPVDIVKIDKSFIDSLAGGARPSPLVSAIVNLGSLLGVGVTAEGIEDAHQLASLRGMGCERGQGYYFYKPMSAAALSAQLGVAELAAQA
jgi:diguanylate cyclase (GGDEF)-like protein/PAS domain S-box-containing protein